jgi:hypothetical protein
MFAVAVTLDCVRPASMLYKTPARIPRHTRQLFGSKINIIAIPGKPFQATVGRIAVIFKKRQSISVGWLDLFQIMRCRVSNSAGYQPPGALHGHVSQQNDFLRENIKTVSGRPDVYFRARPAGDLYFDAE